MLMHIMILFIRKSFNMLIKVVFSILGIQFFLFGSITPFLFQFRQKFTKFTKNMMRLNKLLQKDETAAEVACFILRSELNLFSQWVFWMEFTAVLWSYLFKSSSKLVKIKIREVKLLAKSREHAFEIKTMFMQETEIVEWIQCVCIS